MSQVRSYVQRITRLQEERDALSEDIKEVYAEAKGNGYDRAALRATVKRANADADALSEKEAIEALYWEEYQRGDVGTGNALRAHSQAQVREATHFETPPASEAVSQEREHPADGIGGSAATHVAAGGQRGPSDPEAWPQNSDAGAVAAAPDGALISTKDRSPHPIQPAPAEHEMPDIPPGFRRVLPVDGVSVPHEGRVG